MYINSTKLWYSSFEIKCSLVTAECMYWQRKWPLANAFKFGWHQWEGISRANLQTSSVPQFHPNPSPEGYLGTKSRCRYLETPSSSFISHQSHPISTSKVLALAVANPRWMPILEGGFTWWGWDWPGPERWFNSPYTGEILSYETMRLYNHYLRGWWKERIFVKFQDLDLQDLRNDEVWNFWCALCFVFSWYCQASPWKMAKRECSLTGNHAARVRGTRWKLQQFLQPSSPNLAPKMSKHFHTERVRLQKTHPLYKV